MVRSDVRGDGGRPRVDEPGEQDGDLDPKDDASGSDGDAGARVPEQGGRIVVRLSNGRNGRRIVRVEDNGPGIQAEDIDRIFERFYTDRPASEGFGQNSGLGLSISRQIAEAHGGTLKAENIIDRATGEIKGARFILSLPAGRGK